MIAKAKVRYSFFFMVTLLALFLVYSPVSHAQNWAALPPYNTLWPLWAPALSPIDPVSGLPVPIVNELIPDTILPVQPGLTWDPSAANPWLLYNTPLGMAYYDPILGVNLWPPSYLIDTAGSPLPLALPPDYGFLPPTSSSWLSTNVPLGNAAAFLYLMGIPGPTLAPPLGLFSPIGPVVPPTFGGLFLAPSALFAPAIALPPVAPTVVFPAPTALIPPVTTLFAPVPTALIPPVTTLFAPVPTAIVPPIPTALLPVATAPTIFAPTAIVPPATAVIPLISGIFIL